MAEKRMYNSKMNSKGLEGSVTEDQARDMADNQGTRYLLLVEVHSGSKTVAEDGAVQVQLVPDLVELVPDEHEAAIRTFMNALKAQRPEEAGQLALQGQEQPSVDDAAAGLPAWDGNPDAPADQVGKIGECAFPDCTLNDGHEGDHLPAESEPQSNVAQFSGKKQRS